MVRVRATAHRASLTRLELLQGELAVWRTIPSALCIWPRD